MKRSYHGQMSESFVVGILLCLCGGFQDAYTYVCRDKVFANAQTGNIVLLGNHLAQMDWSGAVRYAVPILAFTAGIFVAQKVHFHFGKSEKIHWRQLILLLEIVVLFAAGFFPTGMSLPANALISFSCAMQVDSFRKIRGNAMATTMCIGNLRSATDLWCAYTETKDKKNPAEKPSVLFLYSGICHWGDTGRYCNGRSRRTRGVDLLYWVVDQFPDYVYPGRSQRF